MSSESIQPPGKELREPAQRSPSQELAAGIRDQLPLLLGVVPFGLLFGALGTTIGLSAYETQGFSLFVFAGSAQFIAAGLIQDGAPAVVLLGTMGVVNLRHLLYSASLAPHVRRLTPRWKWTLSYLLTDEAYAMASTRYRKREVANAHWYFLGTGATLWAAWQISTALGILAGAQLPESWPIDFAAPLTFLALLAPALKDRPSWLAAICAGCLAVAFHHLPLKLGLFFGASLGVAAGLALEILFERSRSEPEADDV